MVASFRRWFFLPLLLGCAASPMDAALDRGDVPAALRAYDAKGADVRRLARIAEVVLAQSARSGDAVLRHAAVGELSRAGVFGRPVLERLADEALDTVTRDEVRRALAPPRNAPPADAPRRPSTDELAAWLGSSDPQKRMQAAVWLRSTEEGVPLLRPRLVLEQDDAVLLQVALGLGNDPQSRARRGPVLARLSARSDRTGLEAASALAATGDGAGLARLRAFAKDADVNLRRSAVWSLAREAGKPTEVRDALVDGDALVRVRAAGGILASLTLVREG